MEEDHKEKTLTSPGVIEKYQAAGKIAEFALGEVIKTCVAGADVYTICQNGNKIIKQEVAKVYSSKNLEKGTAFPVCISVNEVCGHFCPTQEDSIALKDGDLVKIDLGVHIDCFPVSLAHSIIVSGKSDIADRTKVASAAWSALQTAVRTLKVGTSNYDVTHVIKETTDLYNTSPMEGILSHQVKQYFLDGTKVIIGKENPEQKVEQFNISANDIFAIDVVVSANPEEGKSKEAEQRVTVYKRNIDVNYDLKSKNGRALFSEVREKFSDFAFSLNEFEDQLVILLECQNWNKRMS